MILEVHPSFGPHLFEGRLKEKFVREFGNILFIGYWRSREVPDLPDPALYVDLEWRRSSPDVMPVWLHLVGAEARISWMGFSWCRLGCRYVNGSQCLSDGRYMWPSGFAHYVMAHGVRPPDEFVRYVLQTRSDLCPNIR